MPSLTIDGQPVEAPPGTTLLAAAQRLGIRIPTLCHVAELAPLTSCLVCAVELVGQDRLWPACATLAEDGMTVVTNSQAVLSARKAAVELLLSDHLGECEAPCQVSCPARFRVPDFMDDLAAGDVDAATAIARHDLVLAAALGRVCPRLCEHTCRRQQRDQPVAIADLHRYLADREARLSAPASPSGGSETLGVGPAPDSGTALSPLPSVDKSGKTVAIVGAGPAGLAAAFHLMARGHDCTLLEAAAEPGGLLRYATDQERMPRDLLAGEIDLIRRMGARLRMQTRLGPDVTLDALRSEHDAVLLALGAPSWQKLDCEGGELAQPAGELMARLARGEPVDLEGDVVVVGSSVEAVEAAVTAARRGASTVTFLSPRPRAHLPLLERAIKRAQAAGAACHFGVDIQQIRQPAMRFYLTALTADKKPFKMDCNVLLSAVGRQADVAMLSEMGLAVGNRGLAADRATSATNLPGVFAAGEVVGGASFAVWAVAQGRAAAESIDQFLRGRPVTGPARLHTVRYGKLADEERAALLARARSTAAREDIIADEKSARAEATRCLICGCAKPLSCRLRLLASELDGDSARFKGDRRALELDASHPLVNYESHKCVMCGACVQIVEQARDRLGLSYIGRGFNVRVAVPWGGQMAEALGQLARRCAETCPTAALSVKRRLDEPSE